MPCPTTSIPLAGSADASVSPRKPYSDSPSHSNRSGCDRSICPPDARRRRPPTARTSVTGLRGLLAGRRLTAHGLPRGSVAGRICRVDLVCHGVADGVEPLPAPCRVDPSLGPLPLRVVAEEEVAGPLIVGGCLRVRRVGDMRLTAVAELDLITRPAPGAGDQQHQWATAAAPCSSMTAPVVNRSRLNGRASSSVSPRASVEAITQPEAGVALNPPVPQPQSRYRSRIGVGPMIGDASGQTSTIPPQVRSTCARAKIGKSSSAAAIWCSITWNEPRCAYELYVSIPAPSTSSPLWAWLT